MSSNLLSAQPDYNRVTPGDPAPWFVARTSTHAFHKFHTFAGSYVVLTFLVTAHDDIGRTVSGDMAANTNLFDGERIRAFIVSNDPDDEAQKRLIESAGVTSVWDFNGDVARLYGALPRDARGASVARRFSLVLDPTLRVMAMFPIVGDDGCLPAQMLDFLDKLPIPQFFSGIELQAPILYLPQVLEPGLCADLIRYYLATGGTETGVMRQRGNETVEVYDRGHKSRQDCLVEDATLVRFLFSAVMRRVVPEIRKAYQFDATNMERYLIGCYSAEEGGHFAPHRDNTSEGTAHRRFALTINLNDDFDGGTLSFPEYGLRQYKPPVGGAVVFSCSLMHAVAPVTSGRRYAFLPFLHDNNAERHRLEHVRMARKV